VSPSTIYHNNSISLSSPSQIHCLTKWKVLIGDISRTGYLQIPFLFAFSDQDKTLHYSILEGACPIIVYLANHHRKKYIFKSLMKNISKVKTLTFTLLFRGCQKNNDFKITNKTTTLLSLSEMHSISNKRDGNLPMHFPLKAKNVYVKTDV